MVRRKDDDLNGREHAGTPPRMEITGEGLMLGAGTVLATARDERGRPRLALDDDRRVIALLATAHARPVETALSPSSGAPAKRWTEVEKALAHIHLAFAHLPKRCGRA